MNKAIRTIVLVLAGAFALSSAGTALAAYTTPKLVVSDAKPAAGVTINYTVDAADDPTAKLTFYAPKEYSAALTQPAGQSIGTVTAQGTAADLGGALLPLTGTVQVRAAGGTYLSGTTQVPIAAAATQCTGTATHTAYWVLILQAAGQTLELPVFVDSPAVPATSAAFATASIQACLPPPDVPVGTPGRATFGFKLTQVNFKVNGIFTSPGTAEARWRVLATPYNPGKGTPNAAASVEAQSVVAFPRGVTLARPTIKLTKTVATLSIRGGVTTPAGAPVTLRLYRGATQAATTGSVTLKASGAKYSGTLKIARKAKRQIVFLKVRGTLATGTVPCTPTFGVTCLSANRAAVALSSNTVRVVIPAKPKK
jgi:hypothetical protein